MLTGKWTIGVTGASGMPYALRLLNVLAQHSDVTELHIIFSEAALRVLQEEEGLKLSSSSLNSQSLLGISSSKLRFFNPRDIAAPVASGSFKTDGMVIIPCSMATLGAVANGMPQNLIHRAADVNIKEQRKLILVPRETPLSAIHLENMLKLSRMSVAMLAAMPGFYHKPQSLKEMIDMMVLKVLDAMGIDNNLIKRWGDEDKSELKVLKRINQ